MAIQQTMMSVLGIGEVRRVSVLRPGPEAPEAASQEIAVDARGAAMSALLSEFLPSTGFFVHLCVLDDGGQLLADATKVEHGAGDLSRLQSAMRTLARSYPRLGLSRVYIQDAVGTAALVALPREHLLLLVAGKSVALGSISISAAKLAARLAQELEPSRPPAGEQSGNS